MAVAFGLDVMMMMFGDSLGLRKKEGEERRPGEEESGRGVVKYSQAATGRKGSNGAQAGATA